MNRWNKQRVKSNGLHKKNNSGNSRRANIIVLMISHHYWVFGTNTRIFQMIVHEIIDCMVKYFKTFFFYNRVLTIFNIFYGLSYKGSKFQNSPILFVVLLKCSLYKRYVLPKWPLKHYIDHTYFICVYLLKYIFLSTDKIFIIIWCSTYVYNFQVIRIFGPTIQHM